MFLLLPVFSSKHSEPDSCPNCRKTEKIKKVCSYCDFEYKDDDEPLTKFERFLFTIFLIIFLWQLFVFLFTFFGWICGLGGLFNLLWENEKFLFTLPFLTK